MNLNSIKDTAVCRWDAESECFIVESPLFDMATGVDDAEAEAWDIFNSLLEGCYEDYKKGKLYNYTKPGQPTKNRKSLNTTLSPESKDKLKNLADEKGITQGEAIEYLYEYHQAIESRLSIESIALV